MPNKNERIAVYKRALEKLDNPSTYIAGLCLLLQTCSPGYASYHFKEFSEVPRPTSNYRKYWSPSYYWEPGLREPRIVAVTYMMLLALSSKN